MNQLPDDPVVKDRKRLKICGFEIVYRLQRGLRVSRCVFRNFRNGWR